MKKLILLLVCLFWGMLFTLPSPVFAQTPLEGYKCGVFQKDTAGVGYPNQSDYTDRFGNFYTKEELELWNLNLQTNHCDQIEDFMLEFIGDFSTNEMETICDVFEYLSSVIVAPSGEKALIRLRKVNLQNGVAATGTSYFLDQCGLGHSLVHQQLFAGGVNTNQHGFIAVNANIPNFYTGPPADIGLNQVDYYTVILHEALHVLGFGSQITQNGAPFDDFYTLWDLNLVNNNGDHMILSTMPSTSGSCCADYSFNSADFPGMPNLIWNQNCTPSNVKFDVVQVPPVNGEYPNLIMFDAIFMNALSHLDRTCGSEHYVMNPGIPPGIDGVQRTLTNAEAAILCRLGYPTSGCTPDCIVIAENDLILVEQGQTLPIDISTLLDNDFPSSGTFSLIQNCSNLGGNNLVVTGNQIFVTGNNIGTFDFCYSNTSCNGLQCDVGFVRLLVTNPAIAHACENLEDCQVNPHWDFELFNSAIEMSAILNQGNGWLYSDLMFLNLNTPDFYQDNCFFVHNECGAGVSQYNVNHPGNFIRIASSSNATSLVAREGIASELCEPVLPGDIVTVTFIGTTLESCLSLHPLARIEFCTETPIGGQIVYENPGGVISDVNGRVPIIHHEGTNPVFGNYTATIQNNTCVTWNYLLFSLEHIPVGFNAAVFGLFDDIRVNVERNIETVFSMASTVEPEQPCLGSQVKITIEICNQNDCGDNPYPYPSTLITAQLPPGLTLIPNEDFPSLTHLINEGDISPGGCIELTLTVQVSNDFAFDGQVLPINLQFNPLDPCFDEALILAGKVMPMNCNSPGFTCPCTGPNDLNIDAGEPSTNPNDPNVILTSISATVIPSSTVNTFLGLNTLVRPCIAIKGNLIIDDNYNLVIWGGEIRMQPGAKIIVAPGSSLALIQVNGGDGIEQGIHGCEQMWRGIQVRPGGRLYSGLNVIQDAEYAFDLRSEPGIPTTLTSFGNIFDRNHVGIRVRGLVNQPYVFGKNRFNTTSSLLPSFSADITNWDASSSYAGLSLRSTAFLVGSQSDPNSENEFNGLRNGILANRSILNVHYAKFLKTQGVVPSVPNLVNSQGIGIFHYDGTVTIRNSSFENTPRGIHTQRANLDIKNSAFRHVDDAIFTLPGNSNKINIYENEISFRRTGVTVNGGGTLTQVTIDRNKPIETEPSDFLPYAIRLMNMPASSTSIKRVANNIINLHEPKGFGVEINSAGGWHIQENRIEYTNVGSDLEAGIMLNGADNNYLKQNEIRSTIAPNSNFNIGIHLNSSENNTLCCNITADLNTGLRFHGMCDDTKLRHSEIGNHAIGLRCGWLVDPGDPFPTAIIGDQVLAGNKWTGSYSELSAVHFGNILSVQGSEFYSALPMTPPIWPANPLSPAVPTQWFLENTLGGSSTNCIADTDNCPVLPPTPYAPEEPRDLTNNEKLFASGQYTELGAYGLAAQFEGERSLFSKMKRNTSLSGQNGLVDQFFGAAPTSYIGQLYLVDSL